MAAAAVIGSGVESGARSALLVWGGGLLIAGLVLVGAGAGAEGAPVALAGLLNTLYGIHTFGRLGPEDLGPDPGETGDPAARARAASMIWTGLLTALGGGVVAVDRVLGNYATGPWVVTTFGLVLLGLVRVGQGRRAREAAIRGAEAAPVRKKTRRVEKRRRLDKSPAP
jgi:hypothetical protein